MEQEYQIKRKAGQLSTVINQLELNGRQLIIMEAKSKEDIISEKEEEVKKEKDKSNSRNVE